MDHRANHPTTSSVLRAVSSNCKLPYATRLRSTWMLVLPHAGGALCALRASSSTGGDRMARATPTRVQAKRHHTYQGPGQAAPTRVQAKRRHTYQGPGQAARAMYVRHAARNALTLRFCLAAAAAWTPASDSHRSAHMVARCHHHCHWHRRWQAAGLLPVLRK